MRFRAFIRIAVCVLTPLLILACSVAFTGGNIRAWLQAQRDVPLLWLVDFTAFYTFLLMTVAMSGNERAAQREQELIALRQEHLKQLDAIIAQASELDRENNALQEKVTDMDTSRREEHYVLEEETSKLAEQAFRAIQGQIEAHGRQLDAVNLALQHHRAEIGQLRHAVKGGDFSAETPQLAPVSSAEYAAISAPLSLPPERDALRVIQPQRHQEPDAPEDAAAEYHAAVAVPDI